MGAAPSLSIRLAGLALALTMVGCGAEIAPGGPVAEMWPRVREAADSLVARGEWEAAARRLDAAASFIRPPYAAGWQVREWRAARADLASAEQRSVAYRDSLAQAMRDWRASRAASQQDSILVAERFAGSAFAIRSAALGHGHPSTARAALQLADVAFRLSRVGQADSLASIAIPVIERAFGQHPDLALGHEQLGRDLKNYAGGTAREEALGQYRRALRIRSSTLGPMSPVTLGCWHEIGNLERLARRPEPALWAFRFSLDGRRSRYGPVSDEVAATLSAMAILEATQGRWRSAESLAVAMMDATPARGTPPMSRAFRNGVYGQVLRHNGHVDRAIEALSRAVSLNEAAWQASPMDEGSVVQSGMSLHAELALAEVQAGRPIEALAILERGTSRALRERLEGALAEEPGALLGRIQRRLGDDEALVSWVTSRFGMLGADEPAWAVVVRRNSGPHWIRLPRSTSPGPRSLGLYWNELKNSAWWPARVPEGDRIHSMARAAGQAWFTPLAPALGGVRHIVVCSPDLCGGGPPAALADSSGTWLLDRYRFSHSLSMALFARTRERTRPWARSGTAIAVGDPAYPQTMPQPWARLAGSAEEVAAVQGEFPRARVLMGAAASAGAIRQLAHQGMLQRASLIHLTGHTVIDQVNLLESSLVLAPDSRGARDSRLSAREIVEEWRLDADLVCLTGCRSAIGLASAMQGSLGFQHAFLRAGARSVLVSLWPVDDAAAALLVREFYRRLGSGRTVDSRSEALVGAQRALRGYRDAAGRRPYSHPCYWSGFALVGDPD